LNRVVFPAPLGPMRARRSPADTSRLTPSTARRPPKTFDTPSSRRAEAGPLMPRAPSVERPLARLDPDEAPRGEPAEEAQAGGIDGGSPPRRAGVDLDVAAVGGPAGRLELVETDPHAVVGAALEEVRVPGAVPDPPAPRPRAVEDRPHLVERPL